MHKTNPVQVISFIVISTALLCISLIPRQEKQQDEPSKDIKQLDALLLTDLRTQEIEFSDAAKATMDCSNMDEQELKTYFDIENVNYTKCDPGNCHYNSYTIESTTKTGKHISFVLSSGEDGNYVEDLHVEGCGM